MITTQQMKQLKSIALPLDIEAAISWQNTIHLSEWLKTAFKNTNTKINTHVAMRILRSPRKIPKAAEPAAATVKLQENDYHLLSSTLSFGYFQPALASVVGENTQL